jgi:methionyl-tRNA formyltransferase
MRSAASAVKDLALTRALDVWQPDNLHGEKVTDRLRACQADVMVVAAYGLLLPPSVLDVARLGAINVHASLLPRWRGAAPIQRALLAGDEETGISIMRMDAGLDTGSVFAQRRLHIGAHEDFGSLHDRLAVLGAGALVEVLSDLDAGRAAARPQGADGVTYARKIDKAETWLRWERSATELERAVRAFRPRPGAAARLDADVLKIWRASVVPGRGAPGALLQRAAALHVACGAEALSIEELQPAGGRRMPVAEFLRGRRLGPDARLQ